MIWLSPSPHLGVSQPHVHVLLGEIHPEQVVVVVVLAIGTAPVALDITVVFTVLKNR